MKIIRNVLHFFLSNFCLCSFFFSFLFLFMWHILTLQYLLAQSNIFHYVFYAGHGWFCLCLLNAGKYTCVIMLDHFLMTWWIFSFAIVASVCSYRQRLNLPHMPLRFSHTLTNVSVLIIGTLFRFFFILTCIYIKMINKHQCLSSSNGANKNEHNNKISVKNARSSFTLICVFYSRD